MHWCDCGPGKPDVSIIVTSIRTKLWLYCPSRYTSLASELLLYIVATEADSHEVEVRYIQYVAHRYIP